MGCRVTPTGNFLGAGRPTAMPIRPFVTPQYLTDMSTVGAYLSAVFDDREIVEICSAVQDVAIALRVAVKGYQSEDPTLHTLFGAIDLV